MNTASILNELRSERDRIQKAIDALEALNSTVASTRTSKQAAPKQRGRRMSPAARKRMSEAQQKRWADKKNTATPTVTAKKLGSKSTAPARHMSAATKKKLSVAAKKRWAEQKKTAKSA